MEEGSSGGIPGSDIGTEAGTIPEVGLGTPNTVEENWCGEVPEWLNGPVSKTGMGLRSIEGSNPSLSAIFRKPRAIVYVLKGR